MEAEKNYPIKKEKSVSFPIEQNEYVSLSLFSCYQVERKNNRYVTKKERLGEPNILYAFIHTKSGTGKIVTTQGEYVLPTGSLILLDVNKIIEYDSKGEEAWAYRWYNFTPHSPLPFFEQGVVYTLSFTQEEDFLHKSIVDFYYVGDPNAHILATIKFLQLTYYWIYLLDMVNKQKSPHYNALTKVLLHINSHLEEKFKINDLAKMCYLSERQFRDHFKARAGVPPKMYICNQRLKKIASLLITTSLSITALAKQFNYDSPYQLSKEFKKMYGISPSLYRKNPTPKR